MTRSERSSTRLAPVFASLTAARANRLPPVCIVTGEPTSARLRGRLGRNPFYLPLDKTLLGIYIRRRRVARSFFLATMLSALVGIALAIPASIVGNGQPFAAMASTFLVLVIPLFITAIVLLARQVTAVPLRYMVLKADDGTWWVRISKPSPAFAEALRQVTSAQDADPSLGGAAPALPAPVITYRRRDAWSRGFWFVVVALLYQGALLATFGYAIVAVELCLAFGVAMVAASARRHIHVGSIFELTPTNATFLLSIATLAGLSFFIFPPSPLPIASIAGAIVAVLVVIAAECGWNGARTLLARRRP